MTIHKLKVKRNFKLLIVALCILLSVFTLIAISNKTFKNKNVSKNNIPIKNTDIKSEEQVVANNKITKIAFEKNNNVYIYDEINGKIKSVGDNLKLKDLLKVSPDKTKIVFRYFDEEKAIYPPHIIIYDIKTENLTDIVIDNKNVQQIIELKWVDNENILVTGHINPSVSGYVVYNLKSKVELLACVGTIRDIAINKKNILYSNSKHIFPLPKSNLFLNGNKIFEATNDKEQIHDGVISKDGKRIAFRSWLLNAKDSNGEVAEVSAYLNIAKINSDGGSISNLTKIKISGDTTGDMEFDDKNNISIVSNEFIYKLKDDKLIKMENTTPKKPELSTEQLKKFKLVLAEQFPKEPIVEETLFEDIDIYNMEAF